MDKTGMDKSSACGGKDLWCPECRFHNRKKCVVLDQDHFGLVLILGGGLRRTRKISMERGISGLGWLWEDIRTILRIVLHRPIEFYRAPHYRAQSWKGRESIQLSLWITALKGKWFRIASSNATIRILFGFQFNQTTIPTPSTNPAVKESFHGFSLNEASIALRAGLKVLTEFIVLTFWRTKSSCVVKSSPKAPFIRAKASDMGAYTSLRESLPLISLSSANWPVSLSSIDQTLDHLSAGLKPIWNTSSEQTVDAGSMVYKYSKSLV